MSRKPKKLLLIKVKRKNKESFNQKMNQVCDHQKYLEQISRICCDFRIGSLKHQIMAISETMQKDEVINVALLGRFKAGKSSFLNSLIGRSIMPVAVLPLTSVITYVRYGPEDRAEIKFHNGQVRAVSLNELDNFVTEEGNPKNIKQVSRVDVEITDLKELSEIHFVDTPGFGSAYKHNTLTSTGWLPKVGAAFVAVSVGHPLSEEDISLLKDLCSHTPEIIILLTKVDLVSSGEVNKVAEFIRSQIKSHLHKEFRIFPFSNKPGFESNRQAVYEFILQSIAGNHDQKLEEIIKHKLYSTLSKCVDYLRLALLAADSAQESRQQLYRQLQEESQNLPIIQNEMKLVSEDLASRLQTDLYDGFQKLCPSVSNQLIKELKEQMPHWSGNVDKITETFQEWIKEALINHLGAISEELGPKLSESYLNTALNSFSRIVCAFQGRLAQRIESALHTKFAGATFEVRIEKPKQPDLRLDFLFVMSWEMLRYIVPTPLLRPLFRRKFIHRIPWETEKNLGRLSYQWLGAASGSIDTMAQQSIEFVKNEIATIENILTEATDQRKEIENAIIELGNIRSAISKQEYGILK